MRYDELPQSDNIEDRRGEGGGAGGGGFGFPMGMGGGGSSIGTIVVLGIVGYALGIDPSVLIGGAEIFSGGGQQQQQQRTQPGKTGAPSDEMGKFVSRILGSSEVQWKQIFDAGRTTLQGADAGDVLRRTQANQCGLAQSAMGPFYCPADNKIYLDTSFFREIERRFNGCDAGSRACQFAQAYVIAHEVGHHVQNLLGILTKAHAQQRGLAKAAANNIQVRIELQADCFAGIWAAQVGPAMEVHRAGRCRGRDAHGRGDR